MKNMKDLAEHDNEYMSLLIDNDKFTPLMLSIRTSHDHKYDDIKYWLNHRISWAKTWKETIYCIKNGILQQPVCKICGKPITFKNFNNGYRIYCSSKCAMKDADVKDRISKRNSENGKTRGEKISRTKHNRTKEQIDAEIYKGKQTRLHLYGDENYVNIEKTKQTNLKRWGHECTLHSEQLKGTYENKISDEGRLKLSNYRKELWETEEYRENTVRKLREAQKNLSEESKESKLRGYHEWWNNVLTEEQRKEHNKNVSVSVHKWHDSLTNEQKKEIYNKTYATRKTNGTLNTSAPEDSLADYILEKFPDMIRQYKSIEYPSSCDYYIPCIDTYIELQGNWTHGGHPYGTQKEDEDILNKWKDKHTKYYDVAITVWTRSDVNKRRISKQNSLNFYELWGTSDTDMKKHYKFIDKLYEEYTRNCK